MLVFVLLGMTYLIINQIFMVDMVHTINPSILNDQYASVAEILAVVFISLESVIVVGNIGKYLVKYSLH